VLKDAGVQIAPSTYYAAKTRPPSARSLTDAATTAMIERVHADNFGVYGARKVHAELHRRGHPVARCTVQRLMRTAGLRGITRAKGPRTTVPGSGPDTRPDLVDRAFTATGPDQLWVADIVRHEAPWIRVEVRDLHRRVVAAARLELRAV
jgi:putative transposase